MLRTVWADIKNLFERLNNLWNGIGTLQLWIGGRKTCHSQKKKYVLLAIMRYSLSKPFGRRPDSGCF